MNGMCPLDIIVEEMDKLDPSMASDYFPDYIYNYVKELSDREQMEYISNMFGLRIPRHSVSKWLSEFCEVTLPELI